MVQLQKCDLTLTSSRKSLICWRDSLSLSNIFKLLLLSTNQELICSVDLLNSCHFWILPSIMLLRCSVRWTTPFHCWDRSCSFCWNTSGFATSPAWTILCPSLITAWRTCWLVNISLSNFWWEWKKSFETDVSGQSIEKTCFAILLKKSVVLFNSPILLRKGSSRLWDFDS